MACTLHVTTTDGYAIHAPLTTPDQVWTLPRGSLVRTRPGVCEGVPVEVLSTAGWYAVPDAPDPGTAGCLAPAALAPVDGLVFVALAGTPGFPAGHTFGPVTPPEECGGDRYQFGGVTLPASTLATLRAVAPDTLAGADRVRAVYTELFGPLGRHQVPWTEWGYVGLPLPRPLDAEALGMEYLREGLDTPARREKATVAWGPTVGIAHDVPIYQHFLGADAPGSDTWGRPETIIALLRLVRGWWDHCGQREGADCTLQIGDLAWYNPVSPDPLGHKDHADGRCLDLRLFRTDGSRYEAWWNRPDDRTGVHAYDGARTEAFLRFALANAPVTEAFFNDPRVVAAVPGVRPLRGHDDHVHICLGAP